MVAKLRQLPAQAQAFLQLASCMGNQFDARMIALMSDRSLQYVVGELTQAVREERSK